MRIIYLTDIHGSFERIKKLLNETFADVYIISGDLIDIPFYNMETAIRYDELYTFFHALRINKKSKLLLEDFVDGILNSHESTEDIMKKASKYHYYTIRARRVMKQKYQLIENIVSMKKSKIFCLPGNYDMDLRYTSLHERDLHLQWHKVQGMSFAGYGGADIWTAGVPEKYVVKYKAGIGTNDTDNEMYNFFKAIKPDVLVAHQPAHGIHDRVTYRGPSGSPALRSYCDNHEVRLCLTGHIHEDWGFKEAEGTVYLNPSNFGELTIMSGDVVEGGTFYRIEIENREVSYVILQKIVENRIYDIMEHIKIDGQWKENIIDKDRYIALKKSENYDSKTVKISHIPEINLYNDIKEFFRVFQTKETRKRIEKLEKVAKSIEEKVEGFAMDVGGSVNMGLTSPSSDIDIVLYIYCTSPCEAEITDCPTMRNAKTLLEQNIAEEFKFEIIDCINLNRVVKSIKEKNYECEVTQRFVAYRAMFRPINYKILAPIEDLLNEDMEFRKELEGSVRSYLRILANTSDHIKSFEKYKARVNSLGIKIPNSIKRKIQEYLQVSSSTDSQ